MKESQSSYLYKIVTNLALFGILLALYLVWQQFGQPTIKPCSINATINCDAVISGPVSKTFGIPTPFIGLTGYIIILISALLKKKHILLAMTTGGLAFCLWLAFVELVQLKVVCPVCVMCQITMLAIFVLALKIHKEK